MTLYEETCSYCDFTNRTVEVKDGDALPSCGQCKHCGKTQTLELFEVDTSTLTDYVDEYLGEIRTFSTGATRDTDQNKLDYDGFLSPSVIQRFAVYMHGNRIQSDGSLRASDNWKAGIPIDEYMKSMWRHFMEVWSIHQAQDDEADIETALCALKFNVDGMLHELLK